MYVNLSFKTFHTTFIQRLTCVVLFKYNNTIYQQSVTINTLTVVEFRNILLGHLRMEKRQIDIENFSLSMCQKKKFPLKTQHICSIYKLIKYEWRMQKDDIYRI